MAPGNHAWLVHSTSPLTKSVTFLLAALSALGTHVLALGVLSLPGTLVRFLGAYKQLLGVYLIPGSPT
jgi:hypothetical protein